MNIAIISWKFPVTSETFIIDHIIGLIDIGHNVKIFAFEKETLNIIHKEITEYNLLDKTRYVVFPKSKIERSIKGFKIIIKYLFKKPLIIIRCLNIFEYKHNAINLAVLFKVSPFLDDKFDIIHCHFMAIGKEFLILKDILKTKFITTIHGDDEGISIKKSELSLKILFKKADLLLPVSEYCRKELIEMGGDPEKIKVHHMGVKLDDIPKKQSGFSGKINLLSVARLTEKKGFEYSIKAVAKSIKKHPNIIYKIIGDGTLKDELQSLLKNLKVEDKIKLLGAKSRNEVIKELGQANIFILSSITDSCGVREGIPVSLIEAQGAELPVLSTFHSGIPELIIDKESGFLVQEKDVDTLSEKLNILIEHPELWDKMGKFGRKYVEEHFDNRKLMQKLENIYLEVLMN